MNGFIGFLVLELVTLVTGSCCYIHVNKGVKMFVLWRKISSSQSFLSSVYVSRLCAATFYRQSAVHKDVYPEVPSSSSSSRNDLMDKDEPIKFSTSGANTHRAYDTFFRKTNAPWYQVHCITGSVVVFLLYFCLFREENDVDELLNKTIWDKVPQLREEHLVRKIREGKQLGTDTSELDKELKELRKQQK